STAEPLLPNLATRLYQKAKFVLNLYGPTEAGVWNTWHLINPEDLKAFNIPIGMPLSNNELLVLNVNFEPLPLGSVGEIFIIGDSLAVGYWGNLKATQEKFLSNSTISKKLLYRTGDIGYIDQNFLVHYIERSDNQVKILGRRVDISAIDSTIQKY